MIRFGSSPSVSTTHRRNGPLPHDRNTRLAATRTLLPTLKRRTPPSFQLRGVAAKARKNSASTAGRKRTRNTESVNSTVWPDLPACQALAYRSAFRIRAGLNITSFPAQFPNDSRAAEGHAERCYQVESGFPLFVAQSGSQRLCGVARNHYRVRRATLSRTETNDRVTYQAAGRAFTSRRSKE